MTNTGEYSPTLTQSMFHPFLKAALNRLADLSAADQCCLCILPEDVPLLAVFVPGRGPLDEHRGLK